MNWIELFGVITALLYLYLEIRQNRYMWVVGGVSAIIYTFLFFYSHLYASMGLQIWYIGASLYGWIVWSREGDAEPLRVKKMERKKGLYSALLALLGLSLLYPILTNYSSDPLPLMDALIAALSMLATYWVTQKYIEHWFLWIVVNLLASYTYFVQSLWITALLYLFYTAASLYGFFHWQKESSILE